jgi:hypothetical protein
MLRSTNPAAVNEIDPHRDHRRPYLGQRVIFHSRPGEGRMGKTEAIADVIGIEDDDHVEILIHYAADDAIVRWKIPRRTEQNPFNSWSFTEHDQENYQQTTALWQEVKPAGHLTWDDVEKMHAEIGMLRNKIAAAEGRLIALEAKPKRGRPPGSGTKHEPETGETEGAELASELGYEQEESATFAREVLK